MQEALVYSCRCVLARSSSGIAEPVFVLDPRRLDTRSYNDFDLSGG